MTTQDKDCIAELEQQNAELRKALQWVSVDDCLPPPETDVLVRCLRHGNQESFDVAGIFHGEWASCATEANTKGVVTHWRAIEPLRTADSQQAKDAEIVPKWEGEFKSFEQWVNKGQSWLKSPSHRPAICIDAKGRRCTIGSDMMRARDEGAFPVRYFWEFEPIATLSSSEGRK